MASKNLTLEDKKRLAGKVVELYFSASLDQLFVDDIRKIWNEYIKSLAPDAPENMLFKSNAYLRDTRKAGTAFEISVHGCFEAFLPCTEIRSWTQFMIDVDKCPDPRFTMAVSMYVDHNKKKSEFERLLRSRLVNINTEKQLKEQMPEISQYLDSEISAQNLPVAIDVEAIEVSMEPMEMSA